MSSYLGRYAQHYDLIYREKPYQHEAASILTILQKNKASETKTLLDLACGTGSHAFEFEKLNLQVTGVDYSADLLQVARNKAKQLNSQVNFIEMDMRKLELPQFKFDAVTCLFDSIGYLQTNPDIVSVFKNVKTHLSNDGLLILEFWHATPMLRDYDPLRVKTWDFSGGQLMRIAESQLDFEKQTCEVNYKLFELYENGTFTTYGETQTNRFFLLQEMKALLELGGFRVVENYSDFSLNKTIDSSTWHILTVAKKID